MTLNSSSCIRVEWWRNMFHHDYRASYQGFAGTKIGKAGTDGVHLDQEGLPFFQISVAIVNGKVVCGEESVFGPGELST